MMRRAFSLVEVILAIVIVSIVSGALLDTFVAFFASYAQTEDYATARLEIENAFRTLTPQITNAGLGMPNNRTEEGSFCAAFATKESAPTADQASVMAFMGDFTRANTAWGGPVTVARGDICSDPALATTAALPDGSYVGPELFYAWAQPTGVVLSADIRDPLGNPLQPAVPHAESKGSVGYDAVSQDVRFWSDEGALLLLKPTTGVAGMDVLQSVFSQDQASRANSWLVFPSCGAPCLIAHLNADSFSVRMAPHSYHNNFALSKKVLVGGMLYGFEEVHRVRVARLRVLNDTLVQEIYDGTAAAPTRTEHLARNIAAVCFQFDPVARTLRMSVAARGTETGGKVASGVSDAWPKDVAPVDDYFSAEDLRRRILVESTTWRVRN